jgi:hypothetical protein
LQTGQGRLVTDAFTEEGLMFRWLTTLVITAASTLVLLAQDPGQAPKQSAADPAVRYPLTEREGPWLIHLACFRGDDSLDFAHRLAEEIRQKHRMPSFIFSLNEADARRDREQLRRWQLENIGSDKVAESNEEIKLRTIRIVKEYSVFIGNYPDMERARLAVERMRELPPPTSIPAFGVHLYKEPEKQAGGSSSNPYGIFGGGGTKSVEGKKMNDSQGNPYRQAFVVRNPLLKRDREVVVKQNNPAPTFDPSWKELNEKEKYSIFTCPKNWTLVVAQFKPPEQIESTIRNSVVQMSMNPLPANLGAGLERAAETARQFAEILRDGGRGYDAYVFHTRQFSVVSVGAFDGPDDPQLEQAATILRNFALQHRGKTESPFCLLMPMPMKMQVPGRNVPVTPGR